jgi:hypothetical protein
MTERWEFIKVGLVGLTSIGITAFGVILGFYFAGFIVGVFTGFISGLLFICLIVMSEKCEEKTSGGEEMTTKHGFKLRIEIETTDAVSLIDIDREIMNLLIKLNRPVKGIMHVEYSDY